MPQFTKITKVGAFSDDVATQINNNFAQLGTVLMAHGIDVHEEVKEPDPKALPRRERTPLDTPQPPPDTTPPHEHQEPEPGEHGETEPEDNSNPPKRGGRDARHK